MPATLRQRIHEMCRDYMLGRLDVVLDRIDDDIEFIVHAPPDIVAPRPRQKGKAALGVILLQVQAEFEYLSYRPHVIAGNGTTAAVAIAARLRRRSTGEIVDLFVADFVRFRDGLLVELLEFVDYAEAIEQIFARRNGIVK